MDSEYCDTCFISYDEYKGDKSCPLCISYKEITKLKQQLEAANKVIKFYGNEKSWVQESEGLWYGIITHEDMSSVKCLVHEEEFGEPFADKGGRHAREYRRDWD